MPRAAAPAREGGGGARGALCSARTFRPVLPPQTQEAAKGPQARRPGWWQQPGDTKLVGDTERPGGMGLGLPAQDCHRDPLC